MLEHRWKLRVGPFMCRPDLVGRRHLINYYWRGNWIFASGLRSVTINMRFKCIFIYLIRGWLRLSVRPHTLPYGGHVRRA